MPTATSNPTTTDVPLTTATICCLLNALEQAAPDSGYTNQQYAARELLQTALKGLTK